MNRMLRRLHPMTPVLAITCMVLPCAARANVVCAPTPNVLNFGSSSTAAGSVGYTCTSFETTPQQFTLCLGIGNPSFPGSAAQPILRLDPSPGLRFNVFSNPAVTQVWNAANPLTSPISIPGGIGNQVSGVFNFYGAIAAGQNPVPGNYSAFFFNTVLGFNLPGDPVCRINAGILNGQDFTLAVEANVVNACTVDADATLDLGTVAAASTNLSGSSTIRVTCPPGTAYFVGLAPSNGSSVGAGVMSGTGTNADRVPYQLRSGSSTGPIWGNTATTTNVGNGVAGTGNGAPQSLPVHVSVPSANYAPDTYADTVTVNVNY